MIGNFLGSGNIFLGFSFHGLSLIRLLRSHPIYPQFWDKNFFFILEYLSPPPKSIFGCQHAGHGEAIVRKYSPILRPQVILQICLSFFFFFSLPENAEMLYSLFLQERPGQNSGQQDERWSVKDVWQKGWGVGCRLRSECGYGGSGRNYPKCISHIRDCAMERPCSVSWMGPWDSHLLDANHSELIRGPKSTCHVKRLALSSP